MSGFVDLYTAGDTFLHRMDPRVKMLAVLLFSLLAFVLSELIHLVALLAFIFLLLVLVRASVSRTMFALKFVLRFMALIMVMWPLFDPSGTPVLAELGPVKVTVPGIVHGLTAAARVGCLATVWYILIFTTAQRDLVRALVKMGVRFDIGLTLAISLRFFPAFSFLIDSVMDAQRARGMDFAKGNILTRSKNYVAVLAPAVVTALRMTDTISLALQSRAYGARADRTYLRDLRMRWSDYVAASVVMIIFAVPVFARFVLDIGV